MTMGECIRAARKKAGITVTELSRISGVPESTIWGYETSVAKRPIENMIAIADVLGLSLDELVGHERKGEMRHGA